MKILFYSFAFFILFIAPCSGQLKSSFDSIDFNLFKSYNVDFKSFTLHGSRGFNYNENQDDISNFFNLSFSQNSYTNLEKKQTSHTNYTNTFFFKNSNFGDQIIINLMAQNSERHYYSPNLYYEAIYYGSINSNYLFQNDNTTKDEFNAFMHGSLGIRFGEGRINPIDEVFTAAFIVDEIRSEGIDVSSFDQATLFELGQLLVLMRNKRIVDSRRLKVRQFLELKKFMASHINADEESNAIVSAIVMDNLFFANNPSRFSGYRISFGINPAGAYATKNQNQSFNSLSFLTSINFEYNKVISRYFNFNSYTNFEANKVKSLNSTSDLMFAAKANFGISYYPISRTNMSAAINFSKDKTDSNLSFTSNIHYFINYNTYFDVSFKLEFLKEKSTNYGFNIYHAFY